MVLRQLALARQWEPKDIALVVGFWVVAAVIFLIKEHINKKKGQKGEDLAKIRQVLKRLLPDYESWTTAYATYKTSRYQGRRVTRTYYHYAIAFKPGALFIVPIRYSGGEVSWEGSGALLTRDNLSKVDLSGVEAALFGLDGKELCRFDVWGSNTRQDKYEPFNIQQEEESKAFASFIQEFAGEVNGK